MHILQTKEYQMTTSNLQYSPWSLLPAPDPKNTSHKADYFYEHVAKHLVKDTVRITSNGLGIDLNEVMHLEDTIDESIDKVRAALQTNPIILQYFDQVHARKIEEEIELQTSKLHTPDQHLVPFKHSDQVHRSYFMHLFAQQQRISEPSDLLPSGVPKWPANLVKKFTATYPLLSRLLDGTLSHPLIDASMQLLAEHKCNMYNSKYLAKINSPNVPYPTFNPRSPDARTIVFTDILGFESNKLTDGYKKYERELERAIRYNKPHPVEPKNKYSWGRKQLEQLLDSLSDPDQISLVSNMIEFSFGDKIKSSFIPAFYKYTVNGRLYSNLKLLGAKSARYTSSNPNMLQLPSTGSIYAKAVKKCFVAAPGRIILTADFNALEDRVMASITRDPNKTMLQLDPELDGHLFHATMYFKADFERICGKLPHRELTIKAKQLMDAGNKEIKDLRQKSKAVTLTNKRLYTEMYIENHTNAGNSP